MFKMDHTFSNFTDIDFPKHKEIVYILYFREKAGGDDIPLYMGETSRGVGRFGDYISAKFTAATDLKVGEAIRYLTSLGFDIRIKYKEFSNRKMEEKTIINQLQSKSRLLNELEGFQYKGANEHDERLKIKKFIDILVQEKGIRKNESIVRQSSMPKKETAISNKPNAITIASAIHGICEELGKGGRIILREDIIVRAKRLGINESSILPADYCDNTDTGKWSRHSFLHSVGRGKYTLRSS
jgi:hypothetical protein